MLAVSTGLEMVLAPVAQALGHEYTPGRVGVQPGTPSARRKVTSVNRDDPEAVARAEKRDATLLMAASKAGIAIEL